MADVVDFPDLDCPGLDTPEAVKAAVRLLPAWFTVRMMTDSWSFGLLLETGHTLCIESIDAVRQGADGTIWIDVEMRTDVPIESCGGLHKQFITAPTSRTRASVQASKIVAALRLTDS